jgi:acetyltransferase
MVDPDPVVRRLAALAGASGVPMMHTMMGTLQRKAEWFQILERAGVPAFDDGEEMLTAAAFCARDRALRAAISDHP